jgi:hypothetical protein
MTGGCDGDQPDGFPIVQFGNPVSLVWVHAEADLFRVLRTGLHLGNGRQEFFGVRGKVDGRGPGGGEDSDLYAGLQGALHVFGGCGLRALDIAGFFAVGRVQIVEEDREESRAARHCLPRLRRSCRRGAVRTCGGGGGSSARVCVASDTGEGRDLPLLAIVKDAEIRWCETRHCAPVTIANRDADLYQPGLGAEGERLRRIRLAAHAYFAGSGGLLAVEQRQQECRGSRQNSHPIEMSPHLPLPSCLQILYARYWGTAASLVSGHPVFSSLRTLRLCERNLKKSLTEAQRTQRPNQTTASPSE